ncbi:tigger transposable element-derived protein 4-like [Rhipicephalus sanguineus]|uniref:tigger transposable element-derived protein 4-like n=1 Tax=Rhipicephalus sanguineus TaxID=34632 RepID=UPI0018958ECE|nr:tigger transposable element-derived protein 4-like [Rhipicephalus sanguineus]
MDGSDKRPLLVIGKPKKPRGFAKVLSMPVLYTHNRKAWMMGEIFRKWLTDLDKEMFAKKRKVLLLLVNCSAHHVNTHLRAVEILFLPPDTTAKMQPMDQGVIANFKVHYRRRVIERRLTDIRTADNAIDLKVPLVKAVFFASGAWRDVKSETILHCFEKAGFSRGSSAAEEITPEADIDAAAADGAAAVTSLGQLWEAAGIASLVPSGLDYLEFALVDQDLVATEELTTDELVASVSKKGMAASSSSSDGEGDDIGASQPGTAGAPLAAVDTLHMYLCSEEGSCDLLDNVEHRVLKCALAKRVQKDP